VALACPQLDATEIHVSHAVKDTKSRARATWLVAGSVFSLIVAGTLVAYFMSRGSFRAQPVMAKPGLTLAVSVEPFELSDSVTGHWQPAAFAESLASRLSEVPGLHAQAMRSSNGAQYTLRGRVTLQDGRLVLATRLGRGAANDTVWTATFWRNPASANSILPDLAAAVAEAVFGETVRLAQQREKK
jgi:TolB-like protein